MILSYDHFLMDLHVRELKMQERRKETSRRDFIREICSRRPVTFYKIGNFISRYPESPRIGKIVWHKEAAEQRDALVNYGLSYDESKWFFAQMQKLFTAIPLENTLLFSWCENSEYADQSMGAKNSYLSYSVITSENILYTILSNRSTNVFNSISVVEWENIYRCHNVVKGYNIFYSKHIDNSHDLRFCTNMIGCQECLFSHDLDNTSYCIYNTQYSKDEYFQKKTELLAQKETFLKSFLQLSPEKTISISENVSGRYITDCSDTENGYYIQATHDSHNVIFIAGGEWCDQLHDTYAAAWLPWWHNYYGIMWCTGGDNVYNSVIIPRCTNTYYSYGMEACSFCLGCVGLVNKSFCILNKQYTKEERLVLADKIFAQMDKEGVLWEFLPWWMNPFYFNDTTAYLMDDSFSKEEITAQWYLWRDEEIKVDIPAGAETVKTHDIGKYEGYTQEGEREINPEILKKVIVDEKGNSYRIVKMEYDFLMKHGLPLPEIHWLERIKLGFKFK